MRIACGTVNFRKLPFEEALERIARAGYRYVEPQANPPFCPHVDVWRDDPDEFRRRIADFGFEGVTAIWTSHGAIIPDAESVAAIQATLQWAQAAGIPVVNASDGHKPQEMTDEEALELLGDRLAQILETAAQCRVFLALEPHGSFSLTPDGLHRLMALSDSPWLGINYDTANIHRAAYVETRGGQSFWTPLGVPQDEVATLRSVIGRVVHCHVKDVRGTDCVALGQGEVNVAGCLQVLAEHGYQGAISVETEGEGDPDSQQRLIEESRLYLSAV